MEFFVASNITLNRFSMIDLSTVPLSELKAEVARRTAIEREARKKAKEERVSCRNCAYRIMGRANYGKIQGQESWVCYMRPKKFKTYQGSGPEYTRAYYSCSPFIKECEMFVHKNSEEGAKIRKKLFPMASRI